MRRLINDGQNVVNEWIEGYTSAFNEYVEQDPDNPGVILGKHIADKHVKIIIGGGSGHEPLFPGYIGKNLADASVAGNINTSPSPQAVYEAIKKVDTGEGVLMLYGNYSGDCMNFDMAAEMAEDEGHKVDSLPITDDVFSAKNVSDRRGVAGDLIVIKAAAAAAAQGKNLAEVKAAAEMANRQTHSMGMALSSETNPLTGKEVFTMEEGDMEIGMGIHGEPGIKREKLKSADEVVSEMTDYILADMKTDENTQVYVILNGLGGLPLMDQFICYRKLAQILQENKIKVYHALVGNYATSMDMIGMSITLAQLTPELQELLDFPCDAPYWRV